jgi:hypothetical protein
LDDVVKKAAEGEAGAYTQKAEVAGQELLLAGGREGLVGLQDVAQLAHALVDLSPRLLHIHSPVCVHYTRGARC